MTEETTEGRVDPEAQEALPEGFEAPPPAEETLKVLRELAEKYVALQKELADLGEKSKKVGEALGETDKRMVEIFRSINKRNETYDDLGRFQLDTQTQVSILAADRDAVKTWLLEQPDGADIVETKEDFSTARLKSLLKEYRDKGKSYPPEIIKLVDITRIKRVPPKQ